MASLVGKAAEDDEAFWGNSIWGEDGSDNESFVAEDDQPDEFDSDFNDTETEDEEESGDDDDRESSKRTKSVSQLFCVSVICVKYFITFLMKFTETHS